MKEKYGIEYTDIVFKSVLILFGIFLLSFYKMMVESGDNLAHLKLVEAMLNKNVNGGYMLHMKVYPLYHFCTRIVSFFCLNDIHIAAMLVLTLANLASVIIMRRIMFIICFKKDVIQRYILDLLTVLYLVFETIPGPLTNGRIYARQCGANPWHNPTVTFVRPIGLVALYFFLKYIEEVDSNLVNRKHLATFSVFSALSVIAKPSFMMTFLPAMGLFAISFLIKDIKGRFFVGVDLLVSVLPTVAILLFQFLFFQYYNNGTVSPVAFHFGGFSDFTALEIVTVSIATFPVPIMGLVLYRRRIFDVAYSKIGYIALFFGVLEMFFFTNGPAGDFSWGYDLAVGVATMTTLATSMTIEDGKWKQVVLLAVFTCQVVIGFYYIVEIYETRGGYWF